jgi:beta-phosphoglucomutase-like phosphatase (HAD superfamily)
MRAKLAPMLYDEPITKPLRQWAPASISMPFEWYLQRAGHALLEDFERCAKVPIDRDRCIREMHDIFLSSLSQLKEIDSVTSIARAFEGRMPLAVASGGPRVIVMATLHAMKLASLFDTIVTIEDVEKPKPAPDLFIEAARRLRVAPESCLVFEDSQEGLEAAKRCSMKACDVIGGACSSLTN